MLIRVLKLLKNTPQYVFARALNARLKRHCISGARTRFGSGADISNLIGDPQRICIGDDCLIHGRIGLFAPDGRVKIGDYCFVSEGSRIWSAVSIHIGNRVLISHNVNIIDSNSHSLSAQLRHQEYLATIGLGPPRLDASVKHRPIFIDDDVWLGFNVSVMRGVTIGRGAIIAANTVVTKDVEPFAIIAGNPARTVGQAQA